MTQTQDRQTSEEDDTDTDTKTDRLIHRHTVQTHRHEHEHTLKLRLSQPFFQTWFSCSLHGITRLSAQHQMWIFTFCPQYGPVDVQVYFNCVSGFAGLNCERLLDQCEKSPRPCGLGTCTSSVNSYTCNCTGTGEKSSKLYPCTCKFNRWNCPKSHVDMEYVPAVSTPTPVTVLEQVRNPPNCIPVPVSLTGEIVPKAMWTWNMYQQCQLLHL